MKRKQRSRHVGAIVVVGLGVAAADCAFIDFTLTGPGGTSSGSGGATGSSSSAVASSSSSSATSGTGGTGGGSSDAGCEPPLWYKDLGAAGNDLAQAIALDGLGNLAITGTFAMMVDFGKGPITSNGGAEVFVAKFTTNDGGPVWAQGFPNGDVPQPAMGVAFSPSGTLLVVAGTSLVANGLAVDGGPLPLGPVVMAFDQGGKYVWDYAPGGGASSSAFSVTVDSSTNVLVTGTFTGPVTFGAGPSCSSPTGAAPGDAFVVKLDGTTGSCLWSKSLGATGSYGATGRGIAVDPSGDVFVTGDFSGTAAFDTCQLNNPGTNPNIFVAKLSQLDGHCLWAKGFSNQARQVGRTLAVAGSDVVVAGDFGGVVNFGGNPLSSGDGGPAVDIFMVKLAGSNGGQVWSEVLGFGDPYEDVFRPKGLSVAVDPGGNVVLTGSFFADPACKGNGAPYKCRDLFVAKRDPMGGKTWTRFYGDIAGNTEDQLGYGVAVDNSGTYIAGTATVGIDLGCPDASLPVGGHGGRDILFFKLPP